MMTRKLCWQVVVILSCVGISAGCSQRLWPPTFGDMQDQHDKIGEQIKVHDTGMTAQHQIMSPQVAEKIAEVAKASQAELEKLRKEVIDADSLLKVHVETVAKTAADLVLRLFGIPASVSVADWVKDTVGTETREVRDDMEKKIEKEVKLVSDKSATAENLAREREKEIKAIRDRLGKMELAKQLNDKDLARLEAAVQARRTELEAALNDPDKLRSAVLAVAKDAGLRPEAIAALEKANNQDLLKLIITLLGGGALGAAASRVGGSRGQRELDNVTRRMERIENHAPSPTSPPTKPI